MSVSVVIPTYDRSRLLERALESVLAQSSPPLEVIVIDDGSSDGTGDMLGKRFPDVRYCVQENRGVSSARNLGIREARGEWIALLDSDDEWLPQKLERQLAALAESPGYLLCHCDEIWMRRGVRVNQGARHARSGGRIFRECLPLCVISPSSALVHRTAFDDVGFFDETLPACEDYDFWLRFCARYPVLYVPEPLVVKHGGRDDQLSRRIEGLDRHRVRALEKIIEEGGLVAGDERAARRMLAEKARIFAHGARRRGRVEEADRFERLADRHELAAAHGAEKDRR